MDPLIDLGHSRVRLSAIRYDAATRAANLGRLYVSGAPARCLCVPAPIEMGVAKRADRVPPVFYLYHLRKGDPLLHHPDCPHRVAPDQDHPPTLPLGREGSSAAADSAPSSSEASSVVVHVPQLEPRRVRTPPAPTLSGLPALLDVLLISSGLNVWHPGFAGHRSYFHTRFRLVEASKRIRPFGSSTLADLLYFPPAWDPSRKEEIDAEWQCFLETLAHRPDGVIPRGIIIGRAREYEIRENWSAPRIRLSDSRISLWLDGCPRLFGDHPPPANTWLVCLAVELWPVSQRLRVVDGAGTLVNSNGVPLASPAHVALANRLTAEGASFVAPLLCDPETSSAYPDLLVTGRDSAPIRVSPSAEDRISAAHVEAVRA